ncbi:MAG: ABC transporter substrate-binding protein [Bacteroidia bacterium]|nr:ABC transporter substrate-binding protein [Bacteroidia bacterium]
MTGQWLTLPLTCQSVVSFSPALSDAFIQMGLGAILKGISVYCVHPSPEIRKGRAIVGSYGSYKAEVLDSIQPEVVFTTTGYQLDFAKKLAEKYPVYAVRLPLTLSDLIATCVEVGIVCGYPEAAHALQQKLIAELADYIRRSETKLKAYVEIQLGEPITFGAYSYITDALRWVGMENIFGNHPVEWLHPDPAFVREHNPDLILYEPEMFSRRRDPEAIKETLLSRFGEIDAIRKGHIFITPGIYDFFAHHGPTFIGRVLPFLSQIIEKLSGGPTQ